MKNLVTYSCSFPWKSCVSSTYERPVGAIRIEFEHSPNEEFLATVLPPNILDKSVGLVNLNDTLRTVVSIKVQ